MNGFSRPLGYYRSAENGAVLLVHNLDKAVRVILCHSAVHTLHSHEAHADVVSATVLVARLGFSDTRTRNLGVGEGRPRHELRDTLGRAGEQRVAGSDERLITSVVGELRSADHIARRVDVLDVGAQGAVDRYATLCEPYACAQQLHRVDVGSAPSRN